jgi:hypothetical protein
MRRRFAILFLAVAFASMFGAAACGEGAKEEPVEDQQERQTTRGPVQEPAPPEPTQVEEPTTDRTVGKNIYG